MLGHQLKEALRLGHNYIGTEHILIGLTEKEKVLQRKFLPNSEQIYLARQQVIQLLSGYSGSFEQDGETVVRAKNISGNWRKRRKFEFLNGSRPIWRKLFGSRKKERGFPLMEGLVKLNVSLVLSRRTKNNPVLISERCR